MAATTKRHIPELDGLRGLAALAVVFHHVAQVYLPFTQGRLLHLTLNLWMLGFLGVDVFFALSGFLITSILLEKRGTPHYYRNFYMRRLLRLAPAYLITLGLVWALVPGSGPYLLLSLLYLANMAPFFHVTATYGLLWTLSVEEHFYLIWPWLVRWLRLRGLAAVCVLLCTLTPLARILAARQGGLDPTLSWYRFDGVAWGGLLALLVHSPQRGWTRRFSSTVAAAGTLLLLAGLALTKLHLRELGASVLYSAAAMVSTGTIGLAAQQTGTRSFAWLRSRLLRRAGEISYWVYLTHYIPLGASVLLLQRYAAPALASAGWGTVLLASAATLIPTLLTGLWVRRWVELPVLRLKSRFR